MSGLRKDITNQVFGSLTAIRYHHSNDAGLAFWEYACKCGKTHIARANTITHQAKKGDPDVPSCGCVELSRKTKHGFRKATNTHPAYRAYRSMMDRCYNESSKSYHWYGGIGVTVCGEWIGNPAAFVEWSLKNGWAKGLHVDKDILCKEKGIFPGVYSPDTCKWVSAKTNVGFATNRDNYGKHPNIKLAHHQVDEICRLYFSGQLTVKTELAQLYGVAPNTIARILTLAQGPV